jgi:hypothetical protein
MILAMNEVEIVSGNCKVIGRSVSVAQTAKSAKRVNDSHRKGKLGLNQNSIWSTKGRHSWSIYSLKAATYTSQQV